MNSVIITVAGTARRFNKDTTTNTLKSLYYKEDAQNSLLCQILNKADRADEFIIVGGYLYELLTAFIEQHCRRWKERIKLIYNVEYETYGSGYSLILGTKAISPLSNEVIFIEGDLFFDQLSYDLLENSSKDALTITNDPILSSKAVALYVDAVNKLHYVYDTSHSLLKINEEFRAIYNSAQMWKFISPAKLRNVISELPQKQIEGTNLEIIQKYFGTLTETQIDIVLIKDWYNCNTVEDYNSVFEKIKKWRD